MTERLVSPRQSAGAAPAGHDNIPSLDGLRALAVGIVFVSHVGFAVPVPGGFGVTIFFFLSGFLITTLLAREWDRWGTVSLRAFYARRVIRLIPPLLVTLAGAVALALAGLVPADLDPATLLSQIFFFYNYFAVATGDRSAGVEGLRVLWSLSVEEHFYLVFPLVFIGVARGRVRLWQIGALLAAILGWRVVRWHLLGTSDWTIYVSTDTRFDSLLWGCLLALLWWKTDFRARVPGGGAGMWFLMGLALLGITISLLYRDESFRATWRYTLQGAALLVLFHYAVSRPDHPLFRPLNWAWIRMVGVWSYTLYLGHHVLIWAIRTNLPEISILGLATLAAAFSVGWAVLVWWLIERPLARVRRRLTGHLPRLDKDSVAPGGSAPSPRAAALRKGGSP